MDVGTEVVRIVKEQFEHKLVELKPETKFFEELSADSLDIVEIVLAFEEQFAIDIQDEDIEKIETVQDAIDYVKAHAKT